MINILTAKEMFNVTKRERDRQHNEWLESIKQGIWKEAKKGNTRFEFDCEEESDFEELRNIYEPLGYKLDLAQLFYETPTATISWKQES